MVVALGQAAYNRTPPRPAHERDTFSPSDGPERDLEEVSMNAFLVELDNKPGELARITERSRPKA